MYISIVDLFMIPIIKKNSLDGLNFSMEFICGADLSFSIDQDTTSGVEILNKSDYVEKMAVILSDVSKFQHMGNTTGRAHTSCLEKQMVKRLLELCK